ncbi:hypothetical protein M3Y94_00842100 [Aphelenchoides besseyi]|nr:hypothetical protein M3Y94_00842100 [Aphelenchoides besseyi]
MVFTASNNSKDESFGGLLLICNSIGEREADAFAQHQTKKMEHQKEIGRDRVDSIINNDPFRYERPYYRPSSWYLLLLTIQLTAIIVFQFAFASIIISFKLFEFLPLPCLSFLSYLCTIFALARPCRLLLLPHIFI